MILAGMALAMFTLQSASMKPTATASFTWNRMEHNFGRIEQNEPVVAEFKFENSGTEPLMILSAKGSCGCTVADYTKGEILPGDYGTVSATYDAAKPGTFHKTVTVTANIKGEPVILTVRGEVIARE